MVQKSRSFFQQKYGTYPRFQKDFIIYTYQVIQSDLFIS